MKQELLASFGGFDDFLIYLAIALALLWLFVKIYIWITPYPEWTLIREGNKAAAWSMGGTILGMVIPLASAIENSVSLPDMALWGVIALAVQLLVFVFVKIYAIPTIAQDIPAGKESAGMVFGALSLGVGLLNAACMTW